MKAKITKMALKSSKKTEAKGNKMVPKCQKKKIEQIY